MFFAAAALQHVRTVRVVLAQRFEGAADDAFPRQGGRWLGWFGGVGGGSGGHGSSPVYCGECRWV